MITGMEIIHKTFRHLRRVRVKLHRHHVLKLINGGDGLHLDGVINIMFPKNLTLGKNIHIGTGTFINCRGGVTIGDYSILSRCVTIYSYNHNFKFPTRLPYDQDLILEPVHIGRYVWVGMNVTIAPGTVIGDGAVIGIGTVVCGNIPENAIVVGAKPRILGYRDTNLMDSLANRGLFYRPEVKPDGSASAKEY